MGKSIFDLGTEYVRLMGLSVDGFDEETGEYLSDEQVEAEFDKLEGNIEDKVASCGYVLLRLKADKAQVDEEIKRLKSKSDALSKGYDRLADRVMNLMVLAELPKVDRPSIRVTMPKPTKKVDITDETLIPSEYMKVPDPPPPRPMKNEIKAALKEGKEIPGAQLVDGKQSLRIS